MLQMIKPISPEITQAADLGGGIKVGEVVDLINEAAHMSRVMSQKLASSMDYYAGQDAF